MKQKPLSIIAWISFYIFLATLLASNSFGYLDPDFGWHLRVGESIAQTHTVPHNQIYMWSLAGKTWVDHEWLSNYITYELMNHGGYLAVTAFFILIPLLSLLILNYYVFKQYLRSALEQTVFAIFELGALFACLPHFGIRQQEITFLFLTLLLIIIDSFRREKNIKYILFLPPLLYLWASMHGSYLIGIGITLGWFMYELILFLWPWFKKQIYENSISKKQLVIATGIIIISTALTFLTPYGIKLYSFLSDYATNTYYMSHIQEWRSPFTTPFRYDQIIYSLLVLVFFFGAISSTKKSLKLWQEVLLFLFLVLAMRSVRHFPLWTIGSLMFAVPFFIAPALATRKTLFPRSATVLFILLLLAMSLTCLYATHFTNDPFNQYCSSYPCGAITFLKNHSEYQKLKIFNNYGWGGYIIGVWPQQRLFIDGRLPQYPFNNKTILEEYNTFFNKDLIPEKLKQYGIQMILFKPSPDIYKPDFIERYILGRKEQTYKNDLIDYLNTHSNEWKAVYQDSVSKIWVKQQQ